MEFKPLKNSTMAFVLGTEEEQMLIRLQGRIKRFTRNCIKNLTDEALVQKLVPQTKVSLKQRKKLNALNHSELAKLKDKELSENEKALLDRYNEHRIQLTEKRANGTGKIKKPKKRRDSTLPACCYTNEIEGKRLVSLDVEKFVFAHHILEFGITVFENGRLTTFHYIIKEYLNKSNKKVSKLDKREFYNFGESILISIDELSDILNSHVTIDSILVGHSVHNDLKMLGDYYTCNVKIADTQMMEGNRKSLQALLEMFQIEHSNLHNSGNDAYYTMLALLKMKGLLWE